MNLPSRYRIKMNLIFFSHSDLIFRNCQNTIDNFYIRYIYIGFLINALLYFLFSESIYRNSVAKLTLHCHGLYSINQSINQFLLLITFYNAFTNRVNLNIIIAQNVVIIIITIIVINWIIILKVIIIAPLIRRTVVIWLLQR